MKISYDQLKKQVEDSAYPVEKLTDALLAAADDSYYIHQLSFECQKEGELGLLIILKVLQEDLGAEYLGDLILLARNDSNAAERLYQLAYDEEQMMRLVLLACWNRNFTLARKFLHYFIVSPSELDSRTRFVARIVDVCLDRQTPHVVEEALQILPHGGIEKIVFFLDKCFRLDNQTVAGLILKHISLSEAIDRLMTSNTAYPYAPQVCDWLLKDQPDAVWQHSLQTHPEIRDHIYSQRRVLLQNLPGRPASVDANSTEESEDGRKKI